MSVPVPSGRERRRWPEITQAQRRVFLEALEAGYSVTSAAELAGRHRRRFYDLRLVDEAFASTWDLACDAGPAAVAQVGGAA